MIDLVVTGGTVVTGNDRVRADLLVRDGRVAGLSTEPMPARNRLDADGLLVLPGMVDGHVHFMDPGPAEREDFITGSSAAAVGGVTTVIEHTHAHPVRTPEALREKAAYLADRSVVDYGLLAHVWPEDVPQLRSLWDAGVCGFKIFTCTTHGIHALLPGPLLGALRELASFDGVCLIHCEDESITGEAEARLRASGRMDPGVILEWRTREAEEVAVDTVALLARLTGARVIVAHASRPQSVDAVVRQRGQGARARVETCPQYLYLREQEIHTEGALRKFTPPARSSQEAEGLWKRLASGAVDHVQTDHAPSSCCQKRDGDIWSVPFGLPGIETTLTLLLNGVAAGRLSMERVVQLYAERPARTFGIYPTKGTLLPGSDADFVLVDPSAVRTLTNDSVISKAGWTPFAGMQVQGRPVLTALRGEVIARDGGVVAEPGQGHFLAGRGATGPVSDPRSKAALS